MTPVVDEATGESFVLQLAHGLGGRSDLPIPIAYAQYGGIAVLLVTFVLLGSHWKRPRFDAAGGRPLPLLQRVVDSRFWRTMLRTLGVLGLLAILAVAALGADSSNSNPAPTWLYVWLWVGLVPLSALFGPVVRSMNPYRVLADIGRRAVGTKFARAYPASFGYWPAIAGLLVFTWMELVMPDRDAPSKVFAFVLIYSVIQIGGGMFYGRKWHEHADAFEVYSSFIGHLSPFQRDSSGVLCFGNPLRHLRIFSLTPSALVVVYVLLGSTAFDGLTRTESWSSWTASIEGFLLTVVGTCGLLASISVIAITFTAASWRSRQYVAQNDVTVADVASIFAHTLVPVILGYTVAHYFSLLVFQGQAGFTLASDPFENGWNLFGLTGSAINYSVLSPSTIAVVQVVAILVGHVIGVVAAHDRALSLLPERFKRTGQYALMFCMVLYTFVGIALLLGA